MPIGTSTKPVLFTLPVRANTAQPLERSVPRSANHSAPWTMIGGTLA